MNAIDKFLIHVIAVFLFTLLFLVGAWIGLSLWRFQPIIAVAQFLGWAFVLPLIAINEARREYKQHKQNENN